jgi:bifunctional DNase/RNase
MEYDDIKARGLSSMVEVHVQTLVVSTAPAPCVLVLQPLLEKPTETDDHVSSRIIPIWVGVTEATQLGVALENAKFARPMTHDLMLDALTNLDTRVDHVLISDVRGSMFFARLVLRHHDRLIELDARPSDAISLALRQNAPLYVEDSVLDRASYPFVYRKRADRTTEFEEFKSFVQTLEPEDFEQ